MTKLTAKQLAQRIGNVLVAQPRVDETISTRITNLLRATDAAPTTPNQFHAAFAVLRAARLVSVGNWLAHKLRDRVAIMERQIAKDLMTHAGGFGEASLPSLFNEYQRALDACFDWMHGELTDDLKDLAGILSAHTVAAVTAHFDAAGQMPTQNTSALPLVLGAPLLDHLDKVKSDTLFRLKAETRKAVAAGCTAAETVERLGLTDASVQATVHAASPKFGCLMAMLPSLETVIPNWAADNIASDTLAADGIETETHCTVLYGFALDFDPQEIRDVISGQGGMKLKLGKLSRFECPDYDVIKFSVASPAIVAMNKKLNKTFAEEITPSQWEFNPHITVAYVKKGTNQNLDASAIEGQTVTVRQLLYSLPDKKGRMVIDLQETETDHPKATDHLADTRNKVTAADPLSTTLSIGIRLFDATDNSLAKFIQAAVTSLATDADDESGDEVDAPRMGYTWVSAQDVNVCEFCEFMDGGKWDSEKNPVDDSPELETEPPAHFGCRCSLLPCDLDAELPSGNFRDYLAHYSDTEQKQAFGAENVAAYRRGDLTPAQLMGQQSNEIPLDKFRDMRPVTERSAEHARQVGESSRQRALADRARETRQGLGLPEPAEAGHE